MLLKEIVPRLSRIAIFGVPGLNAPQFAATYHGGAGGRGLRLQFWRCGSRMTYMGRYTRRPERGTSKLVSCCHPLSCTTSSKLIGELALAERLPLISLFGQFPRNRRPHRLMDRT